VSVSGFVYLKVRVNLAVIISFCLVCLQPFSFLVGGKFSNPRRSLIQGGGGGVGMQKNI